MSKEVRVPPLSEKQRTKLDPPYQKTDKPIARIRAPIHHIRSVSRLMIIAWAAYLIAGIVFILWTMNESRQFLARYQQSPECSAGVFTASPQNCRMMVTVQVYGKWISNTLWGGAKGGGHPDKMNFIVRLPNGELRTLSVAIKRYGSTEQGKYEFDWFSISRFLDAEEGEKVQAEYWEGRVIGVTIPLPELLGNPATENKQHTFRTDDHPVYYLSENLSKAVSLLGVLFIALIIWTAVVLLKH